jgi:hypothetical protein
MDPHQVRALAPMPPKSCRLLLYNNEKKIVTKKTNEQCFSEKILIALTS